MSNFLIYLFQVRVEVETCENLRPMANNSNAKGMAASYASGGQYGFSDKVVDGITLTVNSVILTLKSHAFIASFQVYQIVSDGSGIPEIGFSDSYPESAQS